MDSIWPKVFYLSKGGYGHTSLEAAVKDNWGGRPYDDLVNCLKHIKDMPGIDMENAVAAGGNYGGYMMNWIQGHELGRHVSHIYLHVTQSSADGWLYSSKRLCVTTAFSTSHLFCFRPMICHIS